MPDPSKPTPSDFETLVETWFFDTFHGTAVARDTEAWNVAYAAKDELKRRLTESAAAGPASAPV